MAQRVKLHSPSHPGLLLQRAGELKRARVLCDALVRVGQRDFPAHSLVLACTSHTLARLLLPQGPSKLCSLDFLTAATFQHALDFAYTGCLEVAAEEVASLLAAARDLEMEELEQACLRALGTGGHDRVGTGDTTGGHDDGGVENRAGSHDRIGIGDEAGGHDAVDVGNGAGSHDGIGDMAGSHDGIGDMAGGHDGIGDMAGSHDGIGDMAGGHDGASIGDGDPPPHRHLSFLTPARSSHSAARALIPCAIPAGEQLLDHKFCAQGVQEEARQRGHRRVHAGEKPYECGECSKRFTLKHQMETHYRVHTGEKPFQCKLCPQRSRDYSAMIKHLRTHGGAAPYRCTLCCQFCPSLAAMQKHMKGHRPEELPSDWTIETTYLYSSSVSS
uniref:Uncharacterized protein n=1 Tax=Pelusios castaneus TaxID=367368 RepID=A0A8C8S105_9SAUR